MCESLINVVKSSTIIQSLLKLLRLHLHMIKDAPLLNFVWYLCQTSKPIKNILIRWITIIFTTIKKNRSIHIFIQGQLTLINDLFSIVCFSADYIFEFCFVGRQSDSRTVKLSMIRSMSRCQFLLSKSKSIGYVVVVDRKHISVK